MEDPSHSQLEDRYRPALEREAERLRADTAQSAADRRPVVLDQQSVGRLSRMDAMQQQAMAAAQEARRAGRQRAIAGALARLEAGEYGWCEDCGDFIGWKRLDLDPCLTRCVACAS